MSSSLTRSLAVSLGGARASWWLAAALAACWVAVAAAGGPQACAPVYRNFGLTRDGVASGKVWQVASHAMLHGSSLHLLLNLLWLVLVGGKLEHILGPRALLAVFAAGTLGGAAGHLLLAPSGPGAPILVGASGGAMALLLTLTTLSPESRMWPLPVSGRSLGLGLLIASLSLALAHPALGVPGLRHAGRWLASLGVGDLFQFGHACHFGGGIAGWFAGRWILRPRVSLARLRCERTRHEARAAKHAGRPG